MKYEAIRRLSSEHSVRRMCQVLGLKQSSYYQWVGRQAAKAARRADEAELAKRVGEVFKANGCIYGYRKMQRALAMEAMHLSVYRVRKIMRENGYYPIVMKKYKPTHNGKSDGRYLEDRVKQQFRPELLNQMWAGDITYIKTMLGFVYLAVVLDLCSKEVIGYQISERIDTELVKAALGNAIGRTGGAKAQIIFHSDRGCQYSSRAFQTFLAEHNMVGKECPGRLVPMIIPVWRAFSAQQKGNVFIGKSMIT